MPLLDENMEEEVVVNSNDEKEVQDEKQEEQVEQVEENLEEEKKFSQADIDKAVKSRLSIEQRKNKRELEKREKELDKYKELEATVRSGIEAEDLNDLVQKTRKAYEEQGVEIRKYEPSSNARDSQKLGVLDAQELIEISEFDEIEARANELAVKRENNKITVREDAEFMKLGEYLTNQIKVRALREKGVDEKILDDKDFNAFAKKFSEDTPISEILDLYEKINKPKEEKPRSSGSVKSIQTKEEVKDYYSPEDVDKLTAQDLRNPRIYAQVMKSRLKWKKEN